MKGDEPQELTNVEVIGNHYKSNFAGIVGVMSLLQEVQERMGEEKSRDIRRLHHSSSVQATERWRVSGEESGDHREGFFCLFLRWDK